MSEEEFTRVIGGLAKLVPESDAQQEAKSERKDGA